MVAPIPNELVASILDNLHSDTHALLNCALVGRAWVYPSQRGIFRQIVLEMPLLYIPSVIYEAEIEALLETSELLISSFNTNSSLLLYVRSLQLIKFRKLPDTAKRYQDAVYNAAANIVQQLSNCNVDKVRLLVHWNDLPLSLKASLTGMLRSPSITSLTLNQFYVSTFAEVASWLSHMPHLKALNVQMFGNSWDVPKPSVPAELENEVCGSPSQSIQLEHLQLTTDTEFTTFAAWFQQECCPFEVQNLQYSIKNCITSKLAFDMLQVQDIGSKIRELSLHSGIAATSLFHLGYTPNIHSLKLDVSPNYLIAPVPFILDLFTPVPKTNSIYSNSGRFPLRHLRINMSVPALSSESVAQICQWDQWELVDILLAKQEFVLLETVQICVIFSLTLMHVDDEREVRKPLSGKLPLLERLKKLDVSYIGPHNLSNCILSLAG